MKKLFIMSAFIFLPLITFSDLLPEPDILINNEESIISNIDNNELESSITTEENGDNISENIDNIVSEESIDENKELINQADLVDVYFWFCNEWIDNITDTLNAAVEQWKPFPVCLVLFNSNTEYPAYLDISLVFGVKWSDWSDVCWLESMDKFITSWQLWQVEIPADNYLIKEIEITYPFWYDWEQKACIWVSSVDQNEKDEAWGLILLARRVFQASFFVWAADWIKNLLDISNLETNFDDNWELIMSFFVENKGNMENTYEIAWYVKWLLKYKKDFLATSGKVSPWNNQFVELNLWSLPSYGWKYNIDFTINGTPYFSYDISNANVDPARLEPKSWEFSTSVFKMPWLILAVVVIFILLLIVLFKKPKQKVVYVQQQPAQPIQPQQPVQPQQVQAQQSMQQPAQQYSQPVQPSQPVQQPVQPTQPVQPQQPQNPNYPQN